MKISENRVCFVNARGKHTCKCFKNGKRVSCNKLRIVPKLDNAAANEIDVGFKLPNIFNMWPFSRKKGSRRVSRKGTRKGTKMGTKMGTRKGWQHGGSRRIGGKGGVFVSANCKKSGNKINCSNAIGW